MTLTDFEFTAIDQLTRQTEYGALCQCLLESTALLLPESNCSLLEVFDDRGQAAWRQPELEHLVVRQFPSRETLKHPSWLAEALDTTPEQGEIARYTRAESDLICFGRLNGIWRFLAFSPSHKSAEMSAIWRLATVFSNLMRMIDRFERDPLTGLFNRQSFDDRFEDLIEYHQQNPKRERTTQNVWLAITDIDHFKRINDTFGHLLGDEILLLVSQIMRESFRFDDLLFRYGGEEFIVILNNTDETGAALALERFRRAVREYDFPRIDQLTLSIGWAAIGKSEYATDIIHRADKALYSAKARGRDCVLRYEGDLGEN